MIYVTYEKTKGVMHLNELHPFIYHFLLSIQFYFLLNDIKLPQINFDAALLISLIPPLFIPFDH